MREVSQKYSLLFLLSFSISLEEKCLMIHFDNYFPLNNLIFTHRFFIVVNFYCLNSSYCYRNYHHVLFFKKYVHFYLLLKGNYYYFLIYFNSFDFANSHKIRQLQKCFKQYACIALDYLFNS